MKTVIQGLMTDIWFTLMPSEKSLVRSAEGTRPLALSSLTPIRSAGRLITNTTYGTSSVHARDADARPEDGSRGGGGGADELPS